MGRGASYLSRKVLKKSVLCAATLKSWQRLGHPVLQDTLGGKARVALIICCCL